MEKFELKVDLNTPYIKIIRFLGIALVSFFLGVIIFNWMYERNIDWLNVISGILISLVLVLFPGDAKKQSLTINDNGIYLHNYTFQWGQKKEITWEKVKGIGIHKHNIEIRNNIGATEKIRLPLHTKEQLAELTTYIQQVTKAKDLEYVSH